jgi:hypothetical protein
MWWRPFQYHAARAGRNGQESCDSVMFGSGNGFRPRKVELLW